MTTAEIMLLIATASLTGTNIHALFLNNKYSKLVKSLLKGLHAAVEDAGKAEQQSRMWKQSYDQSREYVAWLRGEHGENNAHLVTVVGEYHPETEQPADIHPSALWPALYEPENIADVIETQSKLMTNTNYGKHHHTTADGQRYTSYPEVTAIGPAFGGGIREALGMDQPPTIIEHEELPPFCYCCTCDQTDEHGYQWDPACHLHGAHGKRGCIEHKVPGENCTCGCAVKVVED